MFINILTKGGFMGAFRGCTCLKCTNIEVGLLRLHLQIGWSSETTSANRLVHLRQVHPLTAPPNGYKSKYFVRNNIYLLVIVNHCANVYLGVWKKNIHNFAQKHTNV